MKALLAVGAGALAATTFAGSPSDHAIIAAMKLADQPNYSWTTSVTDDVRSYDIEGKTTRGDWTWLRLPMVKSIAERMGRDAGTEAEAIFRGSDAFVIHTSEGWKTLTEVPRVRPARPTGGRGGTSGNAHAPFAPGGGIMIPLSGPASRRGYSNAQFALNRPHEELAIIVSSHTDMKVEGERVTGTLSDLGAQLLLVHAGQDDIEPITAAGEFELILRGGIVTRYRLRLEGVLLVGRKRVIVRQTSDTVIKEVGATSFEVPEEVRQKLEG